MRLTLRKTTATICAVVALIVLYSNRALIVSNARYAPISPEAAEKAAQRAARIADVTDAFDYAWAGYSTHCFGHDTLHPVTNTCGDSFGGWGATAIDSLTTAIMFEKEPTVVQILEYIAARDFTKAGTGTRIQVFEVTIRHLGSMISAWDLLEGPYRHIAAVPRLRKALYAQMVNLADVLSCAFGTESGVPRDWVDPSTCLTDKATSNTVAGVGTMILEFGRMSDITRNKTYVALARKAEEYLLNPQPIEGQPRPGLLGSFVSVETGLIMDSKGSWGAFADSFYEYLLKAYVYDSKVYAKYLERWLVAADSTIRYIGSHPYGHPEWTLLPSWDAGKTHNSMESLSYFAGGNFILGGIVTNNQTLVNYGLSIADVAGAIYNMTTTGLGPEFVTWTSDCGPTWGKNCDQDSSIRPSDTKFRLRPEVLETWYYAYRATKNTKYVDWTWTAFNAILRYCRTESGFSTIGDVQDKKGGEKLDEQESFVFAEVLKYIYLILIEDSPSPIHVQDSRTGKKNDWVFNTEAHPFLVQGRMV